MKRIIGLFCSITAHSSDPSPQGLYSACCVLHTLGCLIKHHVWQILPALGHVYTAKLRQSFAHPRSARGRENTHPTADTVTVLGLWGLDITCASSRVLVSAPSAVQEGEVPKPSKNLLCLHKVVCPAATAQ